MLTEIRKLFILEKYEMKEVESHEGGRNWIFLCENEGKYHFAIRISLTGDRREEEYLAKTEFVYASEYLIKRIPYAGIGMTTTD